MTDFELKKLFEGWYCSYLEEEKGQWFNRTIAPNAVSGQKTFVIIHFKTSTNDLSGYEDEHLYPDLSFCRSIQKYDFNFETVAKSIKESIHPLFLEKELIF